MTRGQTPCHVLASERTNMNIILTGMPASGKSTVGVILAKVLGYDFVDTDLLIQRSANARLEEIIAERGVALKEGQSLEDLFLERTCLYERYADLTVDESSLGLEDTVKLVRDGLQKIWGCRTK